MALGFVTIFGRGGTNVVMTRDEHVIFAISDDFIMP